MIKNQLRKINKEEFNTEMHWKSWRKWAVASVKPSRGLEFLVSVGWDKFFPQIEMSEETFQRIDEVAELFWDASDKEKIIAIFSAMFGENDEVIRSFFTQFDQAPRISQVIKHGIITELAGVKGLKAFMTGNLKPALTGKDLIARGMKPSPDFGKILNAAWREQLRESEK